VTANRSSTASTLPTPGYRTFWRQYAARQGVDVHGRPLDSERDRQIAELARRVAALERVVAEQSNG
jgi:hypothetical protein